MENDPKKLKILFIITKSNFGGAQRYVFDLATHLPKDKFETAVALGGSGTLKEKLETAGVKTSTLAGLERDIGIFRELKAFRNIFKIIKTVKPDIVHLNSSKAGLLGALASRLYNLRISLLHVFHVPCSVFHVHIVFTAHGFAFKENRGWFQKLLIRALAWLTISLCHRTIAVSEAIKRDACVLPFVKKKIVVIHNGVEKTGLLSKEEARNLIGEKNQKALLVGTVGELHHIKGLGYAIDAFALLKNPSARLCIIGEGEEREHLQTQVEKQNLGTSVFLKGFVQNAARIMSAFDIFLLPSLSEGLSYVLLEAGQAGLPVIASNAGGIPEVIDDMKSGILVKAKRPKEIAGALTFLMEHPEKRKEFGETLSKTVAEKFTLERMVAETVGLYSTP